MNNKVSGPRIFPTAAEDFSRARLESGKTVQEASSSFQLAFDDQEFVLRDEMRPVRLLLELSKPDLLMKDQGIKDTIVVFGSARTPSGAKAEKALADAKSLSADNPEKSNKLNRARRQIHQARYYELSRTFARMLTEQTSAEFGSPIHVITGGGPGIMEAANRGSSEAGGKSIGLNIVLPKEQAPNPYITPELCFRFHYFAMRKMHFLMRAKALVAFPGGYGTLDELFETLTLIQTKKIQPLPVILFGKAYWEKIINWQAIVEEGMIDKEDLSLFHYADTPQEAIDRIIAYLKAHQAR